VEPRRSVLGLEELDAQSLELLPARETMWSLVDVHVMPIIGVNLSMALNAASVGTTASSLAGQQFLVLH
jgi:hypothetical protein